MFSVLVDNKPTVILNCCSIANTLNDSWKKTGSLKFSWVTKYSSELIVQYNTNNTHTATCFQQNFNKCYTDEFREKWNTTRQHYDISSRRAKEREYFTQCFFHFVEWICVRVYIYYHINGKLHWVSFFSFSISKIIFLLNFLALHFCLLFSYFFPKTPFIFVFLFISHFFLYNCNIHRQ